MTSGFKGARTMVMGIVNVTPDSFSDGGKWSSAERALGRGRYLVDSGADLIDIGGESTRPGASAVSSAEELQRILPVVEGLVADGVVVSVDTLHASSASAVIEAGASFVNDVSGGLFDPEMYAVVARAQKVRPLGYVLQHWRGVPSVMNSQAEYGPDLVGEVLRELDLRLEAAAGAGVDLSQVIIDPGLGFAKVGDHDWQILREIERFVSHEYAGYSFRVLVGASRKRSMEVASAFRRSGVEGVGVGVGVGAGAGAG
ncbi:MAG: dihydropteroate synthase, partial [Actinomycetaceae bacterium]|nr:dihydropteroate synthase [Actinomycetaceae bacterium]